MIGADDEGFLARVESKLCGDSAATLGHGDKWRHWAIARIGDGAESLGLVTLEDAVSSVGFGAGVEDAFFDLGNGQREMIERGAFDSGPIPPVISSVLIYWFRRL